MQTALVTGANRGLGLEFARQLLERNWRVHATCRQPNDAQSLRALETKAHDRLRIHTLEVTNEEAVKALRALLSDEAIDLLINNAGIVGPDEQGLGPIDIDAWIQTFRVNTIAPFVVAREFIDSVAKSDRKLIVTISSGMGSIADNASGGYYAYRSSKSGVNMVMRSFAMDVGDRGVTVVVLNPGWVQTDMGGKGATWTAEQSISRMLHVIDGIRPKDNGKFLNYDGNEYAW